MLSIRQPYAWAIAHGYKEEEYRTWSTTYRGPLLIHASLTKTQTEKDAYRDLQRQAPEIPPFDELERGGVVGVCEIVGCAGREGDYAWRVANPRPLPFTPEKGKLSLVRVTKPQLLALVPGRTEGCEVDVGPSHVPHATARHSSPSGARGLWRYGARKRH